MKEKLNLAGTEYCLQAWVKCNAVSPVKFVSNEKVKSSRVLITRATKTYSTLF